MIILAVLMVNQRYSQLNRKESVPRKIRWKDSRITQQEMSWEIGWNTLTCLICLDDPQVNLMVRRNLRIWICNQSLDFFLGQTVDACDLPVAQLV
jgi:hypothetical protein